MGMADFAQFICSLGSRQPGARVVLAPMSGVSDLGMRRVAQDFGASLTITEMVDSDFYTSGEQASRVKADGHGIAGHVVQIAGCDPVTLAEAARLAEAEGAAMVDINMGCPAKKVVGGLAGSALMRDLDQAVALVRAVVGAVAVPVSLKMRLGWDDASRNAPELARRAEAEGVAMLTVHGRTRCQFYKGVADWAAIRAVVDEVDIPVVANGDCASAADARAMLAASGAAAVMVGRAAVGRPWLVGAIGRALAEGGEAETPPAVARMNAALAHYEFLLSGVRRRAGRASRAQASRRLRHPFRLRTRHGASPRARDERPARRCAAAARRSVHPRPYGRQHEVGRMSARRSFRLLGKSKPIGEPLPAVTGVMQALAALQVLDALPNPILTIDEDGVIESANPAAETFFGTSLSAGRRQELESLLPVGSSLLTLIEQIREEGGAINEYRVDLGLPRLGVERLVDIFVSPVMPQSKTMVVMLRERTIAEKLDRQHALRRRARRPRRGLWRRHRRWGCPARRRWRRRAPDAGRRRGRLRRRPGRRPGPGCGRSHRGAARPGCRPG